MPALNFQRRLAPKVTAGTKRSTIRRRRKDGRDPKPGQTLYLFTGMRTKQCQRLLETRCERVRSIQIFPNSFTVLLGQRKLSMAQMQALAWGDGFSSLADMIIWFSRTHGHSFSGLLIEW